MSMTVAKLGRPVTLPKPTASPMPPEKRLQAAVGPGDVFVAGPGVLAKPQHASEGFTGKLRSLPDADLAARGARLEKHLEQHPDGPKAGELKDRLAAVKAETQARQEMAESPLPKFAQRVHELSDEQLGARRDALARKMSAGEEGGPGQAKSVGGDNVAERLAIVDAELARREAAVPGASVPGVASESIDGQTPAGSPRPAEPPHADPGLRRFLELKKGNSFFER